MKKNDSKIEIYKEKVSVREPQDTDVYRDEEDINPYFLKISNRYKTAKIFTVAFLCIFVLSSLFIYGDKLTYENARYVLRDLGQILSEDSLTPAEKIAIDPDGDADYGIYRGNIVIAGESITKILSVTGKEKLSDNTKYTSPTIVSSDKYCIVYSLGAYNLSVYNTVARVYDMKFDTPIYDVAVSDNGYIAVMTDSREYRCVVYLYDSDFTLISTYNKTKYPSSVDLSSDASRIYISVFGTENGAYTTNLTAYEMRSDRPIYQFNYKDALVLEMMNFKNNNAALVFNDRVVFVDENGNKLSETALSSSISLAHFAYDSLTVADTAKDSSVFRFVSNGDTILSQKHSDIIGLLSGDGVTVVQKKGTLVLINDSSTKVIDISFVPKKILFYDGYVFLCCPETVFSYKT